VHSAATLLLPLAAEKSKVPFYIAGGVLAAWAVFVSVGLGLRRADFPGSVAGQRVVSAISALLVLAAVSMAVVTAGSPAKGAVASAATTAPSGGAPPPPQSTQAPAPAAPSSRQAVKRHGRKKAGTAAPAPPSPAPALTSRIALAANPSGLLSFDKKQLSAKAGSVTITFTNSATLEHNVTVAEGSTVLGATPTFVSGARTLTLTLKPGTYTFYCSVPGHRQAGMEGALNVT
jgi:plastocyanin